MRLNTIPAVLLLFLVLCPMAWGGPMKVFVSLPPQKYFVQRIGGEAVEVSVMAAGANPHAYEPKPAQMKELAQATLYFAIGDPFEKVWLPRFRATNPTLRVVETQAGIERMPMEAHEHEEHHGHGHADGEPDPHIWTSPRLAPVIARNIAEGLAAADPARAEAYRANLAVFEAEAAALDADIRAILSPLPPGTEFMVFHPSWGYFARDYGLEQVPIELQGKEPKPRELKALMEKAKAMKVRAVFVQPQFSDKTARTVAEAVDARVVPADPLAADWPANLKAVATRLREAAQ